MEEKKIQNSTKDAETAKPSYEQLKDWCNQLMMQRNQLAQKLEQVSAITNKLPWLFEVLKASTFFSEEFVNSCSKEIELIMTPPEEEEPNKD